MPLNKYKFQATVMYGDREDTVLYDSVRRAARDYGVSSLLILKVLYRANLSGHQADKFTAKSGVVVSLTPIDIPRERPNLSPTSPVYQGNAYTSYAVTRHNQSRSIAKHVLSVRHNGVLYTVAGVPQALRLIVDMSGGLLDSLKPKSTPAYHPFHDAVCSIRGWLSQDKKIRLKLSDTLAFEVAKV